MRKNSVRIESKINSLEFRNKELESTIKTLKERINMLEPTTANKTQSSGISQSDINPTKSRLDGLVQGIHDRVSAYVLLKVE